jgi:hypothetical protein
MSMACYRRILGSRHRLLGLEGNRNRVLSVKRVDDWIPKDLHCCTQLDLGTKDEAEFVITAVVLPFDAIADGVGFKA